MRSNETTTVHFLHGLQNVVHSSTSVLVPKETLGRSQLSVKKKRKKDRKQPKKAKYVVRVTGLGLQRTLSMLPSNERW